MRDDLVIKAFKNNHKEMMHQTMRQYSKLLFNISASILKGVGSQEDIEECVSDVFIYLWKHPERFEAKRGNLKSYLCLVAKSKTIDCYRRLVKVKNIQFPLEQITEGLIIEEPAISEEDEYSRMYYLLKPLKDEHKEMMIRRYINEEKPEKIAKDLGVSVKSVVNALYRSKAKLKLLINSEGRDL